MNTKRTESDLVLDDMLFQLTFPLSREVCCHAINEVITNVVHLYSGALQNSGRGIKISCHTRVLPDYRQYTIFTDCSCM